MTQIPSSRHSAFQVVTGLFSVPKAMRIGVGPTIAAVILVAIVLAAVLAPY